MRNQFRLVVLLVFVVAYASATTVEPPNVKQNEITKDEVHEKPKNLIGALNPRLNKMIILPKDNTIDVSTKPEKTSKSAKSTEKKDESSTIGEYLFTVECHMAN